MARKAGSKARQHRNTISHVRAGERREYLRWVYPDAEVRGMDKRTAGHLLSGPEN